ncbi:hypothetical protein NQ314_016120 [Rhamnusium bicolor]|uniref:Protein kinase domain-containing protein n=1 Tax=Rhamnusium bicolor TaxID=1586634 RepID=A0AAV8WXP0_9CUCU|nr:hypothetical protein NQ314_016120 [Rhamnusium bicolor]
MCEPHADNSSFSRDLAARNILITSNKVLKISDFGMSRTGSYVNRTSKKIPLRWMAIESIEDQKWDSKTDVWSFGVVLWEIGTLGKRLDRPKICTDDLYALMLRCWSENPAERPSFARLVELLDVKRQKIYVEFNQLSPKYVFPPTRNFNEE